MIDEPRSVISVVFLSLLCVSFRPKPADPRPRRAPCGRPSHHSEELKAQLPTEKARLAEIAQLEEEATTLQAQLAPYEAAHSICESKVASTHNNRTYLALAAMSIQWGFLAQLTFVEFSWDLMEPITYFVTYGTQMGKFLVMLG